MIVQVFVAKCDECDIHSHEDEVLLWCETEAEVTTAVKDEIYGWTVTADGKHYCYHCSGNE